MGPIDRRERERLALRARIMKKARRLFAEKGYEAVTMRQIAEAIEYSPRTIYLHFKDKEDLFWELCSEDFRSFGEGMAQVLAIADPVARLRQLGSAYAQFAMSHQHHYRLMFMTRHPEPVGPQDPCKGNPEADAYALLVVTTREALEQGRFRPGLEDPELLAQIVWACLHGVISLELTHGQEAYIPWRPFQARVEAALGMVLHGLLRESDTESIPPSKPKRSRP